MHVPNDKDGLRRALAEWHSSQVGRSSFRTGLNAIDQAAPNGVFQGGAVHELLWPRQSICPTSLALLLAKAAQQKGGAVAWSDPQQELYLPAVSAAGIGLENLILLRCASRADQLWAMAERLRCRGVSATVAFVERMSQIEARRLQLAAERGGGIGIFMRPCARGASHYCAAATRWLIQPAPGNDQLQRWSVQLLHGHGGQIGKVLLLEVDRETCALRVSAPLADRPALAAKPRATA